VGQFRTGTYTKDVHQTPKMFTPESEHLCSDVNTFGPELATKVAPLPLGGRAEI